MTITDSNGTKQDLGTVEINGTSKHLDLGSSMKATSINIYGSQTLDANGSNTITLTGNGTPLTVSGTFTYSTSTVAYTNGTSATILALTGLGGTNGYYNLETNGGGTYTLGGATKVNNDFTVSAGTFAQGTNYDFTIYGNVTLANGTGFTKDAGTGKLILEGDAGTETFEDLTSPKRDLGAVQIGLSPGVTNLKSDMTATSLTINAGDTLNARGWDLDIDTGGISIAATGTLNTTNNTGSSPYATDGTIITDAGNFTIASTGVFTKDANATAGTSLVKMDGGTTKTFTSTTEDIGNFQTATASTHIDLQDACDFDNVTIDGSTTLDSNGFDITVGGSWVNSGSFTAGSKKVTFDAAATGFTIDAGGTGTGKDFYDVTFNNSGGGWTVQTNNMKASNNLTFTSVSSWANSKTISIRVGATLTVAANQDIRMWNSSAIAYSVDSTGSLYSMDHNSADGTLYIWGDYHAQTNDYWSYATDFDGTALSGSSRRVNVVLDTGVTTAVSVDSGKNLEAIGVDSFGYTLVQRNGSSGGYGITVNSSSTINFKYVDFENLKGSTGLNILGGTITSLDYCKFNNMADVGSSDAFITVAAGAITNKTIDHLQFDNSGGGANYNINRTGAGSANAWTLTNYTGSFAGAANELEADANNMIVWSTNLDSAGGRETIDGSVKLDGSATFN